MTFKQYKDTKYEVSKEGVVRNRQTETVLTTHPNDSGYLRVGLFIDGKQYKKFVHKLVYEVFNGTLPEKGYTIYHKDGNIYNNDLSNLDVKTRGEVRKLKTKNKETKFGRRYTEENKVFLLKKYYEEKMSPRQISKEHKISHPYFLEILRTNKWAHLIPKYNIKDDL
jgi:hypothetical protein